MWPFDSGMHKSTQDRIDAPFPQDFARLEDSFSEQETAFTDVSAIACQTGVALLKFKLA